MSIPSRTPNVNMLVILSQDASQYETLVRKADLPRLDIAAFNAVADAKCHGESANILLGDPDLMQAIVPKMPSLSWAQSTWAGVTPLTSEGCRTDYVLTGIKEIFGPMMAEYVIGYMLADERSIVRRYKAQQKRQWDSGKPGRLDGKTLGIMGTGSIGATIAKRAGQFNMTCFGYAQSASPRRHFHRMFGPHQMVEFVSSVDYLISTLPGTPETTGLLDGPIFKAMKPDAVFINVGRGNVVNENALVNALNQGEISGAVLDVFQEEPLPKAHPFWETPGVIITSHTAALSFPEDITPIFIENYERFVSGRPLKFQVDFKKGY